MSYRPEDHEVSLDEARDFRKGGQARLPRNNRITPQGA